VLKDVEQRSVSFPVVEYLRELADKSAAPSTVGAQKTSVLCLPGKITPVLTGLHKPAARASFMSNHP
jgi:hypothetical protein